MTAEATLNSLFRKWIEDDRLTPEAAADRILASRTSRALIRPVLVAYAKRFVRAETRKTERRQSFGDRKGRAQARVELVGRTFALPDGSFVDWLDATPAQHRERALWQRSHASACVEDAELHEKAAAEIEAVGATCLRDMKGTAA